MSRVGHARTSRNRGSVRIARPATAIAPFDRRASDRTSGFPRCRPGAAGGDRGGGRGSDGERVNWPRRSARLPVRPHLRRARSRWRGLRPQDGQPTTWSPSRRNPDPRDSSRGPARDPEPTPLPTPSRPRPSVRTACSSSRRRSSAPGSSSGPSPAARSRSTTARYHKALDIAAPAGNAVRGGGRWRGDLVRLEDQRRRPRGRHRPRQRDHHRLQPPRQRGRGGRRRRSPSARRSPASAAPAPAPGRTSTSR